MTNEEKNIKKYSLVFEYLCEVHMKMPSVLEVLAAMLVLGEQETKDLILLMKEMEAKDD